MNSIGLLKANGEIDEYGNTGGGNTDTIEAQIGYVESTDTAASAHAVGSYFINKTGQFVKTTSAIAVGDTIAVGTNCQATDIAGVLAELNSKIGTFNPLSLDYHVDNIDNITSVSGWSWINSVPGTYPGDASYIPGWFLVFTQPSVAGSYCVQFLAQYLASNLYMRTRVDGQWGTWVTIK